MTNRVILPESQAEQIKAHYELEKRLARKLLASSREERKHLYSELYDELFSKMPYFSKNADVKKRANRVAKEIALLKPFLGSEITFLEVGPGDCMLSFEVSKYVKKVYAVDVSKEIVKKPDSISNFELILSDGCNMPVASDSINIIYSNSLMEHIHPDDAIEQLREIYHSLTQNGLYICATPNRLSGPHDISKYFDDVATGFHLKEYTFIELTSIFRKAGFSKIWAIVGIKKLFIPCPVSIFMWLEWLLNKMPTRLSKRIARFLPIRILLSIRLVGVK